jgi:predicted nucleic acid-binding protein
MSARIFLDTNTLVFVLEGKEPAPGVALTPDEIEANRKGDITLQLLQSSEIFTSVQVFNELCNVTLRRKFDSPKTKEMLATLEALCMDVVPLTWRSTNAAFSCMKNTASTFMMH